MTGILAHHAAFLSDSERLPEPNMQRTIPDKRLAHHAVSSLAAIGFPDPA